jgi:glucose-6-phosphate 1-dehydrogenase
VTVDASVTATREQLCLIEKRPEPCAVVIFGASGDLTFRKLLPSLAFLARTTSLPDSFHILGVARTPMSDEAFRARVREAVAAETADAEAFAAHCHFLTGDYDDPATYRSLRERLTVLDRAHGVTAERRLFYISTPPSLYARIVQRLGEAGLSRPAQADGWVRVVIEKPFGRDLSSARALNDDIHRTLTEDQIYRIDHYLGKETVQNILMFRFANALFEPAWNRHHIDHVQITAAESIGVEHRAGYYESAGVLRDMVQNHLFQLLALIAMEPPTGFDADAVRNRKVDVFKVVRPLRARDVVLGQYGGGLENGDTVPAYRQEPGVAPDSRTPTFAALKLELDNWRWQGVPFYLRSGKRLGRRVTEIAVHFKHVPVSVFQPLLPEQMCPNILRFRIQPDEGISLQFEAKHPGPKLCLSTVNMNFDYRQAFHTPPPEAYARLLLDALTGDATLFTRADGIESCLALLEPLLTDDPTRAVNPYASGTWGPAESDALLASDRRVWDLNSKPG